MGDLGQRISGFLSLIRSIIMRVITDRFSPYKLTSTRLTLMGFSSTTKRELQKQIENLSSARQELRNNEERYQLNLDQLELQLQASQKMETVGQLTSGIVHDFNNLLVAIVGYTELAKVETDSATRSKYLNAIQHTAERATDMTQKLLAYSGRRKTEPKLVNINELMASIDLMINRLIPKNIDVDIKPSHGTGLMIMADMGQIEQVLVNLAVNARDAMEQGGQLTIDTSTILPDDDFIRGQSSVGTGEYVVIRVADTGSGMSQKVQRRIFEPFFTTKPEGSGTGLGLSVVFSIISQYQGHINLESAPGLGTTFSIYLPLVVEHEQQPEPDISTILNTNGGHETICIVEDDEQVRNLTRLILTAVGYQVIDATDGHDAKEKFALFEDEIDLVLMDIVMPQAGGRETMHAMQKLRPDLKILFTSGFVESDDHTSFIQEEGLDFIPKPYNSQTLRSRVRAMLDADSTIGQSI